ncbi:MAG: hypothetical protein AAF940_12420 [Pseudomonadota bacterium]
MRIRRIIIFIATSLSYVTAAGANPFIEADPSVERGAAAQLAKEFGDLRGSITADEIPALPETETDPVSTQSVSRALTPVQWLSARSFIVQEETVSELTDRQDKAVTAIDKPEAVPMDQIKRPVRIVYINNAPL